MQDRTVVLTMLEASEVVRDLGMAHLSGLEEAKLVAAAARFDICAARLRGAVERMAEAKVAQKAQP